MNPIKAVLILVSSLIGVFAYGGDGSLAIDVTLSPAGSFKIETGKVTGFAYKNGESIEARNVTIDLRTIATGVSLRDKHTKDRLMVSQFPEAKLVSASGKDGKGQAVIELKGKKQKVEGTYIVSGNKVKAKFPMKLADLSIKDVRYMGIGVKDTVMVNIELPLKNMQQPVAGAKKPARNVSGK